MPFKNLSSPRRVNDLGAEITAGAALFNPALVAMASSDPVKVAVHPASSSTIKTTGVAVDRVDAIAVLSREVAVVQSGDAAWALLGLVHTPQIEQVARDVRSLHARPAGERALVIGWDGTGTELSLQKSDVEARQFSLRGTVRTADVGENETYVVVEGEGGGQLRVHAGTTPEPGASTRAALPKAAQELDRLRGGQKLAVLYKRGSSVACLVPGGPVRYEAKMVTLEGKVADLGVLETSLFVAYDDGRVAVYDGDAIARASEGGIEARATVSLGAKGHPTTVVVPGRGAPTVWVGTSAGEVLTLAAVRKTPI